MSGPNTVGAALRTWFKSPPRAHGEILNDRTVSFLELFYDLVFVVLIAQIAHTLADVVSWSAFGDFALVFSLLWIAWINGSLYHELHGREDGRARSFIFAQMLLLVLLSVYAGHATDGDGRGFSIVYAILLALLGLQWSGVRRYDTPEFAAATTRYVTGTAVMTVLMAASAFVDNADAQQTIWAIVVALTLGGSLAQTLSQDETRRAAFWVTESMAERSGLFIIIVLGEVVVGVADGLAGAERDAGTIVTGLMALGIGMAFWWNYFDFVGGRSPRSGSGPQTAWMFLHLPMSLFIAAAGAGMVSLIEQAGDNRTPAATSWLLAGATAGIALTLAVLVTTMKRDPGTRLVPFTLAAAAVLALATGAIRPSPLVLALALNVVLGAVWMESFVRHARTGTSIVDH
ncbi:MAG: low temperature requirement protein A [Acidimicrobiia bacterium]|nr:low temperature requirement protein A [Acidimicrobiia bacterium]MDX2467155.1 low temperature requirement protein A [Acidimicrobiia bacterium]